MGQTIEVRGISTVGEVLLVDLDRSLTGQDGMVFEPDQMQEHFGVEGAAPEERRIADLARLATEVFSLDAGINRVHFMSNLVSLSRPDGWPEPARRQLEDRLAGILNFYPTGSG